MVRTVEAGNSATCAHCGAQVKFVARAQLRQVIANVYEEGVWKRVEHFHSDCYEAAGDKASALEQLFTRKQGPTEVRLRIEKPRDFSVILDMTAKVRADKEFRAEVERICGPESVEVLAS